MGSVKISFDSDLRERLNAAQTRFERAARLVTQRNAPLVENHMKLNAPWSDQTSNARNGLAARAYDDKGEFGIVLFHQVDYGIWLETRFNGRYAIIQPTIEAMGPKVMRDFDRLMERI